MKSPIFIIGNPRSGTTLLRLMLNSHSNIVVPPECGFAVWWYEKYKGWNQDSSYDQQALKHFLQDLSTSRKMETWDLDFGALREYLWAVKPSCYAELVSSIYVFFGRSRGKEFHRWGDKNNFYIQHVDTLDAIFPEASFIHIIRDGRDVACSCRNLAKLSIRSKYSPNLPTDIADIAAEWTSNVKKAISSFESIGDERVCEVRYEDLVADSQTELIRICAFLQEPYDEQMLEYYKYNINEHQEPIEFLQWKGKTLEKPTTSEVGKFRHELSIQEIRSFQSIAGCLLERYGYESVP